jgi:hypothetical protein
MGNVREPGFMVALHGTTTARRHRAGFTMAVLTHTSVAIQASVFRRPPAACCFAVLVSTPKPGPTSRQWQRGTTYLRRTGCCLSAAYRNDQLPS